MSPMHSSRAVERAGWAEPPTVVFTVAARPDARRAPRSAISRLAPCLRRGRHHFGEPASDYGLAGKTRWVFRALNVTYAANCAMSSSDTVTGSFITTHCTPSVQGGVVSDPTYR